ncbi:MAG: hypothetical protein GXP46_02850 [Deferribacteres bacterium]|nr:hypothetical protein [Deferribacteres bacterium]
MMIESIREGFNIANRNLPLVLLRVAVTIINVFSFFVFMVVPVAVAAAYMGFDLTHARDLLPSFIDNPLEFVSRYLGLVLLVGTAFVFYLTFASMLLLYAVGGILGVLKNAALDVHYRFSLRSFFSEANGNFFRLLWLVSILFGCLAVVLAVVVAAGLIVAAAAQAFAGGERTIEVFLRSFVTVSIIVFTIMIFIAGAVFSVYCMAASVVEKKGAVDSVKSTFVFLKRKPEAFLFYIILIAGIVGASLVFFILGLPFRVIPVLAPVMNIALSLMNIVFQAYLMVVMWGCLIVYYIKGTDYPAPPSFSPPEIPFR